MTDKPVEQCPTCGKPLEKVRYPSDSMLNRYQWESVRAGDWYCASCPYNGRAKNPVGAYFWDSEVGHDAVSVPQVTPDEQCSSVAPHAAHTWNGRPMKLCKGVPRKYCDHSVRRPTGQCNDCLAYPSEPTDGKDEQPTSLSAEQKALNQAIEQCVGVMGNPGYKGSYAAPREAFGKILAAYSAHQSAQSEYWLCFGCGFKTSDRAEAEAHFGDRDDAEEFKPLCKWWSRLTEDERVETLQDTIQQKNAAESESAALREQLAEARKDYEHNMVIKDCSQCHGSVDIIDSESGGFPAKCHCYQVRCNELRKRAESAEAALATAQQEIKELREGRDWWKADALSLVTLLSAKCSDEEWKKLGGMFKSKNAALQPVPKEEV